MKKETSKRPSPHSGVQKIQPYIPGKAEVVGHANPIKLSSNESPFGASPKVKKALASSWDMERYPDPCARKLRETIAEEFNIDSELILVGSGSEQLLALIAQAYCGPGDEVLHTEYSFISYPIVSMAVGATPIAVQEKNYTTDVDAILEAVTDKTRVVFLANPNNPTGTWVCADEIRRLRDGLPDDVLLVLDVAYAEYMDEPKYTDGIDLVNDAIASGHEHIVVIHTFSKIYGLASFRVGWCYAPPSIIDALHRIRPVFNVSQPAQIAAIAALKDQDHIQKAKEHNLYWFKKMKDALKGFGLKVPSTAGNFLLAIFPQGEQEAEACDAFLQKCGIIVRPVKGYGLGNCLRITIGSKKENLALLKALDIFFKKQA